MVLRFIFPNLLRVWRVDDAERCRAILLNVATDKRVGFDDLSELLTLLEAQTDTFNTVDTNEAMGML